MSCMLVGAALWLLHMACGWETFFEPWISQLGWQLPASLSITLCGLAAYLVCDAGVRIFDR